MAKHESLIYEAMYTAHLHQKHKIWHDGRVKLDSQSRKAILMDDDGRLLGEGWLKEEAQAGTTLKIGQSLVEFGELLQRKPEDRIQPSPSLSRMRVSPMRTPLRPKPSGNTETPLSRVIQAAGAGQYRPGRSKSFDSNTQGRFISNKPAANEQCARISSFHFVDRSAEPIQVASTSVRPGNIQENRVLSTSSVAMPSSPLPQTVPAPSLPTSIREESPLIEQSSHGAMQRLSTLADIYNSTEEGIPEYVEEPDTGPWSSEAYLLFKWRPPA